MNAKEKYDKFHPIVSTRVDRDRFKKINKIVEARSQWQSGLNRSKYLLELIDRDLAQLDI